MDINTNFIAGKMNKSVDERLVPPGQYIDALNVRLGSTETTEIGAVENSKGNTKLTSISYNGQVLSGDATCIGAFSDGVNENIYWFVHDPSSATSSSGVVDMIISYNTTGQSVTYHVVSETVLNFDPKFLVTGVSLIEDLLFFTDDFNPPRKINIKRNYSEPLAGVDQISAEELNVIVKPPGFSSYTTSLGVTEYELARPDIKLVNVPGEENYIVDRFLCFAYRYQYLDNEYSATSLYTTSAFEPGAFFFDPSNYYNEGMENTFNGVEVTFNTGGKLVIAVELLYKESVSNNIFVIERYKKTDLGWSDNSLQTVNFTNSKILSLIGQDELLRLYDNVPRLAKSQTIMGNRLIYGNYVDQYNITTSDGAEIPIDFTASTSSVPVVNANVSAILTTTATNIINPAASLQVSLDTATFDLDDLGISLPILINSQFTLRVKLTSGVVQPAPYNTPLGGDTGSSNFPTTFSTNTPSTEFSIETIVVAQGNYVSFNDFLLSNEFAAAIGDSNTITPISPTAVYGLSLTDELYKVINAPSSPVQYEFVNSGKFSSSPSQQGFRLVVSGNTFKIQVPAIQYQYNPGGGGAIVNVYEYFSYSFTSITQNILPYRGESSDCNFVFSSVSDSSSLHSNRNYDAAIIYMDEFGRASTALVSPNNTVFFDSSTSIDINTIKINIENRPPSWATKYKFVLKPSFGDYNIIYSNQIFQDFQQANISYVRLQGESTSLVSKGDILTVKVESTGDAVLGLVETTVLEVEALAAGDTTITPPVSPLPTGAPAGLYMKLQPQGYSARTNLLSIIDLQFLDARTYNVLGQTNLQENPLIEYPVHRPITLAPIAIPLGSVVSMRFKTRRNDSSVFCRKSLLGVSSPKNYIVKASQDAVSFRDFWNQENINPALFMVSRGDEDITFRYYDQVFLPGDTPAEVDEEMQFYWVQTNSGSPLFLGMRMCSEGCYPAPGVNFHLRIEAQISISINDNFMAFETKPAESDPSLFYDSSEMYNILPDINGDLAHYGDGTIVGQNQVISSGIPAIVTLPFHDCFTYGNGVESYRYRDLSTAKDFILGERVTAVSNNEFKEADRLASLTYSGLYSGTSNVNNLNEFNLGLVNFKDCELVYGPIMKLHSRETDILLLQEDKISYVLVNKNLLSDSTGGGVIVSVPEILGQQVARIEEYGISFNPESFTSWGRDVYFSDTKRGAILKLTGATMKSDQLEVISTYGMRSYFRDKFADQLNTQKLGGYDPYMNEYVFSSNSTPVPFPASTIDCGAQIQRINSSTPLTLTVELGTATGNVDVVINSASPGMDINSIIDWNNNITTSNNLTTSSVITFQKAAPFPTTATITITPNSSSSYNLFFNCVTTQTLNVVQVVLGTPISGLISSGAQTIHYEYRWSNGQFTSPLDSNQVTFSATNNVSAYSINTGQTSIGLYPSNGSTVTMKANKFPNDTYVFNDTENRFYAITSNAVPASSGSTFDLTLLTNESTPIIGSQPDANGVNQIYKATSANLSITSSTQTLYLVWDLRDRQNNDFCYSSVSQADACVGCSVNQPCIGPSNFIMDPAVQTTAALACNGGNGPNGLWLNNPGAYAGFWHSAAPGAPSTNEPVVGDIAYKACGSNPANCCFGGVPADVGFYFSRAQSVIEVGANGEVLSVNLFPCN